MIKLDYQFDVGIAAISWVNDDIPGLGDETSIESILAQMNELGYIATEKGRTFPDDVDELSAVLNNNNITLASQFLSVMFSDSSIREVELAKFKEQVNFLKQMGCQYVIVCEMAGSTHWDNRGPERDRVDKLTNNQWKSLVEGLHDAGEICNKFGMELVYHPHAGTVIEQKEEVDQLMEMTDSKYVNLLYDTGHAVYGNYNPEDLLITYLDRIKYVHYKDVRTEVLKQCRVANKSFREEVVAGIFTVPGDGDIEFKPLMKKLIETGYKGWVIVEAEQDPKKANPYEYAKKAKEYLDKIEKEINEEVKSSDGRIL